MNRTLLIIIGIFCAVITAEVIVLSAPRYNAYRQIHSKNPLIRQMAVCAIYKYDGKSAMPEITKLLQDEDMWVRGIAAFIMVEHDPEGSIPKFRRLLQDNNPILRSLAVFSLGRLDDKEAIPAITKLLKDKEGWMSEEAEKALKKLGVSDEELERLRRDREHP